MGHKTTLLILGMFLGSVLQGCVEMAATGAAAGASAAHDRRTLGTLIDDQGIELKLLDAYIGDKELHSNAHLNFTSYNNVVLVTGEAPTEALRDRAAAIAKKIPNVRRVHNEVALAAPSSMMSRSSDSWITAKVKTKMAGIKNFDFTRVKVVTENGVVYLLGLVTQMEGGTAADAARQVPGVQRVVKIFEYID